MNIAILAAGAGNMYCGSCLGDNTLAAALLRAGHRVALIPLYTPLRTERTDASIGRVFYGGLNVYLQHTAGLFRRTPRLIDWLFDRRWLLRLAGRVASTTEPSRLGSLTISVLAGEHGAIRKELARLTEFLARDVRPDVVILPNAMFLGIAGTLKRRLGVPVVCELAGEDLFLDHLAEPYRQQAWQAIGERSADADALVAPSRYYAEMMASRLNQAGGFIEVVYPGVCVDDVPVPASRPAERPPTIGYLARVCPAKGFDILLEAAAVLRSRPGFSDVRVRAAGWLGSADRRYFDDVVDRWANRGPLAGGFTYLGEVDRRGKLQLLTSVDLLCVPTRHPEPKGIFVLEALACGAPVVLPDHGSFPELVEATAGGLTVRAGDPDALADGLAELLADHDRRETKAAAGRAAVLGKFTDRHLADAMLLVLNSVLR